MRVPLATSAASALVAGLPEKACHNVYAEPHPNDPKTQVALMETPGSLKVNTFANSIRGMWQADGHASAKVLIAQGTQLATYDPPTDTVSALTGAIAGTDRGDFSFTETEGFGLFDGELYVSDGTAITAVADAQFATLLSDAGATEFTSVATLGQRGLFTFGSRFGFTDVLDLDNVTALNYYTAESSPDELIAGRVVGELYYLFGTKTIEPWAQTGDSDDPFGLQPGMTQQVGCACRDGIIRGDNTLFFVDDQYNVRRLGQGASEIISEPWVADLLKTAGADGIRGLYYEDRGHIFLGWRTEDGCAFYDVMTKTWHTRGTNGEESWRYTSMVSVGAQVFVGDDDGQFDELSRDYLSESMADADTMGTEIVREFTAYLAGAPEGFAINTVRLECAKGVGLPNGQGSAPIISMKASTNGGNTWTNSRSRSLGAQGNYDQRTIWRRCGRTGWQGLVLHFLKSDPVREAYMGVILNEDAA